MHTSSAVRLAGVNSERFSLWYYLMPYTLYWFWSSHVYVSSPCTCVVCMHQSQLCAQDIIGDSHSREWGDTIMSIVVVWPKYSPNCAGKKPHNNGTWSSSQTSWWMDTRPMYPAVSCNWLIMLHIGNSCILCRQWQNRVPTHFPLWCNVHVLWMGSSYIVVVYTVIRPLWDM